VKFIESERDAATAPFLTVDANKTCRCWHLRMQGTETELQRRLQVLDRLAQSSDRTREDRALPHMADLTGPGGGLSTHSVARGATDPLTADTCWRTSGYSSKLLSIILMS